MLQVYPLIGDVSALSDTRRLARIDKKEIPKKYKTFEFIKNTRTIYLIAVFQNQNLNYEPAKALSRIALSQIKGVAGSGLIKDINDMINGVFA